ncbi:hypothetical protein MCOR04_010141 [Pyricularia oryzae]|nr:hypothetical protein MCOR04_010141 [Pyricularia oryzae]
MIKRRASPARYLARCVDFGTTTFTKHIRDVTSESSQATRLHWDFGHQEMACNAKKSIIKSNASCNHLHAARAMPEKTIYSQKQDTPMRHHCLHSGKGIAQGMKWMSGGNGKRERDMMEKENILLD